MLKFDSSSHSCKIITMGQGSQIIDVVQRLKLVARQYEMLTRNVLRKVMQKKLVNRIKPQFFAYITTL